VNLERDIDDPASVVGYVPTSRALDVLHRVFPTIQDLAQPRAWSITGPYGSGKSSLANFAIALLGSKTAATRRPAEEALAAVDPALLDVLRIGRDSLRADASGFVLAVATGRREPITVSVGRALANGVPRFWSGPGRRPRFVQEAVALSDGASSGAVADEQILNLIDTVSERAPLILLIDEMGKNLEFAAGAGASGDLFLLQRIAESFAANPERPVFLVGLQHLSFEDYASGLSTSQIQEWSKIQGRFEDLPFIDPPEQTIRVVAGVFERADSTVLSSAVDEWSRAEASVMEKLGLLERIPGGQDTIQAAFPVDALTLLCLPTLCARYGQNDRSLFTFLTGPEPNSVASFIRQQEFGTGELPLVRLDAAYDYFVEAFGLGHISSRDTSRWLEIQGVVRDAHHLDPLSLRILKSIAILNLVAGVGSLRASADVVRLAISGPDRDARASRAFDESLTRLESLGLVVYRDFAGEYRVWRGSDYDIRSSVDLERQRLANTSLVDQLMRTYPPRSVVARRHSQQRAVLRYFERRYVYDLHSVDQIVAHDRSADGLMLLLLGDLPNARSVPNQTADGKPLVIGRTPDTELLRNAALEAAATASLLDSAKELQHDAVARREMRHRAATAQEVLRSRLNHAFSPTRTDVDWYVAGQLLKVTSDNQLLGLLSQVCDQAYNRTPVIPNEMLHRRELTSQGAKARRELMQSMISGEQQDRLGLEGFGPERAMYEAALASTGIHSAGVLGAWSFAAAPKRSSLYPAWRAVEGFLNGAASVPKSIDRVFDLLAAPPYGMKEGAIPVVLLAALLDKADEIAIYQEGIYQPAITPELMERLVKIPERFSVKYYRIEGAKKVLFDELTKKAVLIQQGGRVSRWRNATLLSVVKPLMGLLRSLPEFTLRTNTLSELAAAVRRALVESTEPDVLIFHALPQACGLSDLEERPSPAAVRQFSRSLNEALLELTGAYDALLDLVDHEVRDQFGSPTGGPALREDLRVRSRHLIDRVIDPRMRSFILMAMVGSSEMDDREWIEAVALSLSRKPPRSWLDEDIQRFRNSLSEVGSTFRRLEALWYEARERDDVEGFEAKRLTLTNPGGEEASRVLWVDQKHQQTVKALAEATLAEAARALGNRGPEALLAKMAELVMEDAGQVAEPSATKGA